MQISGLWARGPGRARFCAGSAGFTLLELLVAISLLAFLSLGVYQSTTSTWNTNTALSHESTDMTGVILGLQALQTDLEHMYTPRLGTFTAQGSTEGAQDYWSGPVRADGLRRAHFVGKGESVSFVANNNRRVEADIPQSDFQKIKWEVDRGSNGAYTLYRSTDWDAFRYEDDHAKKPERIAIIENLSSAKFTFYRRSDKTWPDAWDSESTFITKEDSRFPDLIKLKLEAPDPRNEAVPMAWEIEIKPEMPLNYLDATARAALRQRFE